MARFFILWRRERDSNPRYGLTYTHFPGVLLQPLGHLSGIITPVFRKGARINYRASACKYCLFEKSLGSMINCLYFIHKIKVLRRCFLYNPVHMNFQVL